MHRTTVHCPPIVQRDTISATAVAKQQGRGLFEADASHTPQRYVPRPPSGNSSSGSSNGSFAVSGTPSSSGFRLPSLTGSNGTHSSHRASSKTEARLDPRMVALKQEFDAAKARGETITRQHPLALKLDRLIENTKTKSTVKRRGPNLVNHVALELRQQQFGGDLGGVVAGTQHHVAQAAAAEHKRLARVTQPRTVTFTTGTEG